MQPNPETLRAIWGKDAPQHGRTPAIALINPKKADNVAKVVRLASCYGVGQVWWTGNRVELDVTAKNRLPREERMKGYRDVSMIQHDELFDQFPRGTIPVAIEVRENAENLLTFEHPDNPLYVFGPEDGSIPKWALSRCHRFVVIPTRHCLNLATAVATILWDRHYHAFMNAETADEEEHFKLAPGDWEQRGCRPREPEEVLQQRG
jgi:tRNA(Leu) C34 or U34 (ribose-2'-O)-methylase TrmL